MPAEDSMFRAESDVANVTLSAALRMWLPGRPPWSHVERLVRTRHVLVNGNLCLDAARRLKPGEIVKVLAHPAAPLPREDDVVIRFLDTHLVVVEKPAGMTSVRHAEEEGWSAQRRRANPTLEDLLPRVIAKKLAGQRRKPSRDAKPPPSRTPPVRPVHRLDRETSGLMIFARTVPAERSLGQQFRQHTTHRRYLAIAIGDVKEQTIKSRLVRDRGDGRRGSTRNPRLGKEATTHVKPIERLNGYTLVECKLETGRTHQIRIHLADLGHPLCGERVYLQPMNARPMVDPSGAPRMALHAAELAFDHPVTGERMEFEMPLPKDLAKFLIRLRGETRRE